MAHSGRQSDQWQQPWRTGAGFDFADSPMALHGAVFDQLPTTAVIVGSRGTIIAANAAWREFGRDNGLTTSDYAIGANYIGICEGASGPHSEEAPAAVQGVREVLAGFRDDYELEYPCHTNGTRRWFRMQVVAIECSGRRAAMASDTPARHETRITLSPS